MPHDRGGHFFAQYFGVDRFLEIVESSQLDSRHRRTDVRIAGHDDHFAVRRLVPYPFEQRDAVAVGQAQVRQHHVEHAFPHPLDRLLRADDALRLVSVLGQPCPQHEGEGDVILYNQHLCHRIPFVMFFDCKDSNNRIKNKACSQTGLQQDDPISPGDRRAFPCGRERGFSFMGRTDRRFARPCR